MLRPSRPMMRPFMSSDGRLTTETVVSATWLAAVRWMLRERMLRARRSASRARLLLDLAHQLGHVVARLFFGALQERLARLRGAHARDALEGLERLLGVRQPRAPPRASACSPRGRASDWSRRSCSRARASSCSSRWIMRCSALSSSARRSRSSASTSPRTRWTSSLASSLRLFEQGLGLAPGVARRASRPRARRPASLPEARLRRTRYPRPTPAASASTPPRCRIMSSPHRYRHTKRPGNCPACAPLARTERYLSSCRRVQGSGRATCAQTSQTSRVRPLGRVRQAHGRSIAVVYRSARARVSMHRHTRLCVHEDSRGCPFPCQFAGRSCCRGRPRS